MRRAYNNIDIYNIKLFDNAGDDDDDACSMCYTALCRQCMQGDASVVIAILTAVIKTIYLYYVYYSTD